MAHNEDAASPGKFRQLAGPVRQLLNLLLFSLTLIGALWAANAQNMFNLVISTQQYLAVVLGIGLSATFIAVKARPTEAEGSGVPWYDWILVAGTVIATGYIAVDYQRLIAQSSIVTWDKLLLGVVAVLVVMEATRRVVGWFLVGLAAVFILYARFSHLMPSVLEAPNTDWDYLTIYLYIDSNSVVGLPLRVFATIVISFILFGRILYAMNADKFLTEFSLALMGRYRGGSAKVAVGASSLFGTISGSVVSNVVMDGPITIPMMSRSGYPKYMAAAIEAVASTGGQLMPPVMGITAFLIADWLGIPYAEIALAAVIPAVLYYVALFMQVDLEAAKRGLKGLPRVDLPRLRDAMKMGWVFIIPFAALIYTLVFLAWQPGKAAILAVVVAVAAGTLHKDTRPTLGKVMNSFVETGRTLLDLVPIVAIAGLIIGALQISGLAFSLSLLLVSFANGNLFVLLILAALLSIIMGMGLPSTVIYILLAVLVAPGLIEFGVPELSAHLFIFYFGMMSMITPPMCFATFAAATIAGCNFWQAGWAGVRLGIVGYLIPFIFVYQPELLLIGTPLHIVLSCVSALVAVFFTAAAIAGYVFTPLDWPRRILLAVAALALIPSPMAGMTALLFNLLGLVIGCGVLVLQRRGMTSPAKLNMME